MKKYRILGLIGAFLFLSAVPAGAELIRGEIASVNLNTNTLVVTKIEAPGKKGKEVQMTLVPGTELKGIGSLNDLRVGDEIKADAVKNKKTKVWEIQQLTLDKIDIREPIAPPPAAQSPDKYSSQ